MGALWERGTIFGGHLEIPWTRVPPVDFIMVATGRFTWSLATATLMMEPARDGEYSNFHIVLYYHIFYL